MSVKIAPIIKNALSFSIAPLIPLMERAPVSGFTGELLKTIAAARREDVTQELYDTWRYPNGAPARQNSTQASKHLAYFLLNFRKLNDCAENLADHTSKNMLKQLLALRTLGLRKICPPVDVSHMLKNYALAQECQTGSSKISFGPFEFAKYLVPFEGQFVNFDGWLGNVAATFFTRQYYFERNNINISPKAGDIVIDAGACFGDTALAFAITVGPQGRIYSFEPMPDQRKVFETNMAGNPDIQKTIELFEWALDSRSGRTLRFSKSGAASRISKESGEFAVETITIDDFVSKFELPRVDFIKMDIEGAESSALAGAAETIRKFKPRLAISAYHSLHDLVGLIGKIQEIDIKYRFYFDHHSTHYEETILYAVSSVVA